MRAVCMFLLSVGAKIAGRIYDMPTGMAAAAILILMENPAYLLDGRFSAVFWIGDWDWLCLANGAGGDGCIKPEKTK